ncbi:MAG: gamma-glutamyltransferase [Acidobacteriota bacterium]|nr:gamma-glutamyltransferase [Acidobacteriota bacterium]
MMSRRALLALCLISGLIPVVFARQPVRSRSAMVVTQEPLATDVGLSVLKAGGNAIDAAVAVGFALAVTHPYAGNIGGGGFLLARFADGTTTFIDFRERAPQSASHDMYLDASGKLTGGSLAGWRASGVPGSVRGFELAHQKYGKKKWSELLQPAVSLAADGFPASYSFTQSIKTSSALLEQFPESKRIFLKGGDLYSFGETLRQAELAGTLKRIQKYGASEFYEGETAKRLAAAMQANGGTITLEDLKSYQPVVRTPLTGHYRDFEIITAPPPSSGGIGILQMLGMLDGSGYEKTGAGSAASIHYVAEVMRRFYADRSEYFGDPDFFKVPLKKLLDPHYISSRRDTIDRQHATSSEQLHPGNLAARESTETTHYNIVDAEGNAVAVTYTLNGGFGSGVTVPGLGFLLNNEMDDFAAKPGEPNLFGLIQGEANAIQPGKRPLSSMTPTIVVRDGKLFMALGAPGGSRIINGVLQVFLNVADFHMNVQDAVDWPRFHHQWKPDKLYLEKGISPDTIALLKGMGHDVESSEATAVVIARVEAILVSDGWLQGAADGRAASKAAGY